MSVNKVMGIQVGDFVRYRTPDDALWVLQTSKMEVMSITPHHAYPEYDSAEVDFINHKGEIFATRRLSVKELEVVLNDNT